MISCTREAVSHFDQNQSNARTITDAIAYAQSVAVVQPVRLQDDLRRAVGVALTDCRDDEHSSEWQQMSPDRLHAGPTACHA